MVGEGDQSDHSEHIVDRDFVFNPILKPGHMEVFCGPMMSRKSLSLLMGIDYIEHTTNAEYILFKPDKDTRDGPYVKTRFLGQEILVPCTFIPYEHPEEMLKYIDGKNVIGIDEVQFFKGLIVPVLEELRRMKNYVLVSGLDLNFRGEPYGQMPEIIARANDVYKNFGVCSYRIDENHVCGRPAYFTQREKHGQPDDYSSPIDVIENKKGESIYSYHVRCDSHHFVPGRPSLEELLKR